MFWKVCISVLALGPAVMAACGRTAGNRIDGGTGGDALVDSSTGDSGGAGAGGFSLGGATGADASAGGTGGTDSALACPQSSRSNLPGASLVFLDDRCSFTLAEAAAGIQLDFQVEVLQSLKNIDSVSSDAYGRCKGPEQQNPFIVGYDIAGGSQRYCPWCDTGRCAQQHFSFDAVAGESYQAGFTWHGRNYGGPSDTGQTEGTPFPPGSYTVTLDTEGTWPSGEGDSTAFQMVATRTITLTP